MKRADLLIVALLLSVSTPWCLEGCSGSEGTTAAIPERKLADYVRIFSAGGNPALIAQAAAEVEARIQKSGGPLAEDSIAFLYYRGDARRVAFASDINSWNPAADTLIRSPGTAIFYLTVKLDPAARIEYKLVVDSVWALDPRNIFTSATGFGMNSELRFPRYVSPESLRPRADIPRGTIDTLQFTSEILHTTHPVMVYRPRAAGDTLPILIVTDGGEYLSLAGMATILDNCIGTARVRPFIAAFVDPRTDMRTSQTSRRMDEYSLNANFVSCLGKELLPFLRRRYNISDRPENTGIMGASLGGLAATYAALLHPDIFGRSAAQSPAFWWKSDSIFSFIPKERLPGKFYIDTGTIRDAGDRPGRMARALEERGCAVKFIEVPESHNWGNWKARIGTILEYFWPLHEARISP
jgi:enterochelin esterase-like enzyme